MPGKRLRTASRKYAVVATVVITSLVCAVAASSAFAKEPTGDFAIFKQCPRFTTEVTVCLYSTVTGGAVTLNKQTVPINEDKKHPIILQGGTTNKAGHETFVGALNGETLSKTPQNVPGGLTGLINCTEIKGEGLLKPLAELAKAACKEIFENGLTGVEAVTELAKPASEIQISKANLINEEGVALSLPVKVHLVNPFLGSECYIGSASSPLQLALTTGTTSPKSPNEPISGHVNGIKQKDEFNFIELPDVLLVNNEFSAPGATGCGGIFSFLINPLINSKIGLPSENGHNTVIQQAAIYEGTVKSVIESEK